MKNCNCNKKPEPVVPCSNPCDRRDHVIKLFVDECSGRPVDPVTVATAVFTEDCKSVQEMLDALVDAKADLENKLNELEDKTLNSENYQSLISKINRLLESINELNGIKSHLTDYINVIQQIGLLQDKVNSQTLKITNIESDLNSLRSQLASITHDYTALLTSINTILALNKLLFETMLDKLNTGGSGGDIDLHNYYKKSEIDDKINEVKTLINLLEKTVTGIKNLYVRDIKLQGETSNFEKKNNLVTIPKGVLTIAFYNELIDNGFRLEDLFNKAYWDLNWDGKVDVADVNIAINIILGIDDGFPLSRLRHSDSDIQNWPDSTEDSNITVEERSLLISTTFNPVSVSTDGSEATIGQPNLNYRIGKITVNFPDHIKVEDVIDTVLLNANQLISGNSLNIITYSVSEAPILPKSDVIKLKRGADFKPSSIEYVNIKLDSNSNIIFTDSATVQVGDEIETYTKSNRPDNAPSVESNGSNSQNDVIIDKPGYSTTEGDDNSKVQLGWWLIDYKNGGIKATTKVDIALVNDIINIILGLYPSEVSFAYYKGGEKQYTTLAYPYVMYYNITQNKFGYFNENGKWNYTDSLKNT